MVAVAIGHKWLRHANKWDEEPRIVIYLTQKGIVPLFEELLLRSVTSGEAVAKVTVMEAYLKSCALADPRIVPAAVNSFGAYNDVLRPGISVGVRKNDMATCGTMGGYVVDDSCNLYGITNRHGLVPTVCPVKTRSAETALYLYQPSDRDLIENDTPRQRVIGELSSSCVENVAVQDEYDVGIDAAILKIGGEVAVDVTPVFTGEFKSFKYVPEVVAVDEVLNLNKKNRTVLLLSRSGQRVGQLINSFITCSFFPGESNSFGIDDSVDLVRSCLCVPRSEEGSLILNQYKVSFATTTQSGDSGSIVYLLDTEKQTARPFGLFHSRFTVTTETAALEHGICSPLSVILTHFGTKMNTKLVFAVQDRKPLSAINAAIGFFQKALYG